MIHRVREGMRAAGAQAVQLPGLQYRQRWADSGRWGSFEGELFTLTNRDGREMCLAPSHEEGMVHLVDGLVRSYDDLHLLLYQVASKFRDDHARNGLIRCKEFTMKDAYSFHVDEASLADTYAAVREAHADILRHRRRTAAPERPPAGHRRPRHRRVPLARHRLGLHRALPGRRRPRRLRGRGPRGRRRPPRAARPRGRPAVRRRPVGRRALRRGGPAGHPRDGRGRQRLPRDRAGRRGVPGRRDPPGRPRRGGRGRRTVRCGPLRHGAVSRSGQRRRSRVARGSDAVGLGFEPREDGPAHSLRSLRGLRLP